MAGWCQLPLDRVLANVQVIWQTGRKQNASSEENEAMPRGRAVGTKNRNYPPLPLESGLRVPRAIQDEASGMDVSRLTLAEILKISPSSSNFRDLVGCSRFYGLTNGGINAAEYGLTSLGQAATSGDEVAQLAAYKKAVMTVEPYRIFFQAYSNKKLPSATAMREFLVKNASVPESRVGECMEFLLQDAETAGFLRTMKGGAYIDLAGMPPPAFEGLEDEEKEEAEPGEEPNAELPADEGETPAPPAPPPPGKPRKVFIAHGKNRTPLEQLKKMLDQFKVSYAVAVDEPNKGRPISKKVANLMEEECSSGIFIFTADEMFTREGKEGETEEVWRPSENVVYELGAASILYENRIVIFKEKGVTFPSDFSDLGYIEFEKDQLVAETLKLFGELVALDILEVRAKG
jgi:predicted nucleotide-binding protein